LTGGNRRLILCAVPDRAHHRIIWPTVAGWLPGGPAEILDAGCGQGQLSLRMAELGHRVTAIDSLVPDVASAAALRLRSGAQWDLIAGSLEELPLNRRRRFEVVVSIEVVEHLYRPLTALRNLAAVTAPGGIAILSTPYHGWLKNLAISAAGGWDVHHHPLVEGGHIKFWSRATLGAALGAAGFEPVEWRGVGRVPYLWKSIMVKARKR
jgi:2-polyprenyl-6-hydroxyphenyl methylase/3-demethylubiquinone-9 3-methyltransferase